MKCMSAPYPCAPYPCVFACTGYLFCAYAASTVKTFQLLNLHKVLSLYDSRLTALKKKTQSESEWNSE